MTRSLTSHVHRLRPVTIAAALTLALLAGSRPVSAGIADSPLPVLVVGETTLHLYSVPGVVGAASNRTFFSCGALTLPLGAPAHAAPGRKAPAGSRRGIND